MHRFGSFRHLQLDLSCSALHSLLSTIPQLLAFWRFSMHPRVSPAFHIRLSSLQANLDYIESFLEIVSGNSSNYSRDHKDRASVLAYLVVTNSRSLCKHLIIVGMILLHASHLVLLFNCCVVLCCVVLYNVFPSRTCFVLHIRGWVYITRVGPWAFTPYGSGLIH